MRVALLPPHPDRRRAASLALTVVVHLLLLWLLLRVGPSIVAPRPPLSPALVTFDVSPDAAPARTSKAKSRAAASATTRKPPSVVKPPEPIVPPLPKAPRKASEPDLSLFGDKSLFAGGDIAGIRGKADGVGKDDGDSAETYGPGEGAGGMRLYNAEWYREPTDAELRTYMPREVAPGSWGLIACQTAERFHVENCRQLGESPRGSGIARGMRQAAWQFLVRPPRKGGKTLIGAWVKIEISFTETGIKP